MKFLDALNAMEHFDGIAGKILEVYMEMGVFAPHEDPKDAFCTLDEYNYATAGNTSVEAVFHCSSKISDDQWYIRIMIPIEWLENYDEDTARETGQRLAAERHQRAEQTLAHTAELKRQADIATLRRLSAEYPGVIPPDSLK